MNAQTELMRKALEDGLVQKLERTSRELAELRIQRDQLIRAHPGTLREIGQAAGLSPQAVLNIKNRKMHSTD